LKGLPIVLMYHAVMDAPMQADAEERDLMVAPEDFAWQMSDLKARGYRSLTLDEYGTAVEHRSARGREMMLTFDDAYAHVDSVVTPTLRRHGFSAVMFAAYGHLGELNTWDAAHATLGSLAIATAEQIRSMARGPWEVASHSMRHVDLCALDAERCRLDLQESRERLSELVSKEVRDLAYPYGNQNACIRAAAREAGYRMAFTAGRNSTADRFALDRRAVRGTDSRTVFRIKTSGMASLLYGIADRSPVWARSAARGLAVKGSPAR